MKPILNPHAEFRCGDMLVRYVRDPLTPGQMGLVLLPTARRDHTCPPREHLSEPWITSLPASWLPIRAHELDPLIHLHVRGDPQPGGFSAGRSLRRSPSTEALRFHRQRVNRTKRGIRVLTEQRDGRGLVCIHELQHLPGESALRVRTSVCNSGKAPITLELLTSFSLSGITPFATDDAPERLRVHRLRSAWSAEGRHETRTLEELQLERSWAGYGVAAERFGQVGSMPVNGWFPLAAVEDTVAGVTWAAQLTHPGSWQMEFWRRKDQLAFSGGLADRELGHWWKTLAPGERFSAPEARLTCVVGDFASACDRLLTAQAPAEGPAVERKLPIVVNEWCTSWGNPSHDNLIALADRLRGAGATYLVIDDGWAERQADAAIQQNGDWRVNRKAFPQGLQATCAAIRARGLIPGIWFEFEVANAGSDAWSRHAAHFLRRDGAILQVSTRRFWDFRRPWVHAYLRQRVLSLLRECGIGYLKVDYNDSLGLGVDGAESPGEGLRAHLAGVQEFFRELRRELPELVIENCSSGGHRAEPSMIALTHMTSFSDAHETPDIPVIAANLHRTMPSRCLQIWAVLRRNDSLSRLSYSLAAAFLGRLCLSGELHELSPAQWEFVHRATRLYRRVAATIGSAQFRRVVAPASSSWQHLRGAQVVFGRDDSRGRLLIVWHTFAESPRQLTLPLPPRKWRIAHQLDAGTPAELKSPSTLHLHRLAPWQGGLLVLEATATRKTAAIIRRRVGAARRSSS